MPVAMAVPAIPRVSASRRIQERSRPRLERALITLLTTAARMLASGARLQAGSLAGGILAPRPFPGKVE